MAKVRSKDSKAPTSSGPDKPENVKNQNRKKKKRLFWKQKFKLVEKKTQKSTHVVTWSPPKTPQEVSSNWKALQELLKPKAASLDSVVTGLDACSKKQCAAKEEGAVPRLAEGNRTEKRLRGPPVENAKRDHAEAQVCPAFPKWKKPAHGRNLSQTQKDDKEHKRGDINGHVVEDDRDVKRTRRKPEELADIWFDDVDPDDIEAALGREAADVARKRLGVEEKPWEPARPTLVKEEAFEGYLLQCDSVDQGELPTRQRISIQKSFAFVLVD